jgi:hypothetical protein
LATGAWSAAATERRQARAVMRAMTMNLELVAISVTAEEA